VQVVDNKLVPGFLGIEKLKTLTLEEIAPWPVADKKNAGTVVAGLDVSLADVVEMSDLDPTPPSDGNSPYIRVIEPAGGTTGFDVPPPATLL
jgi:hypothetical protein